MPLQSPKSLGKLNFQKPTVVKILRLVYLLLGLLMSILLILAINDLPFISFVYYGELYKFLLLIATVIPAVSFLFICWGLLSYPKRRLITLTSSMIAAIWYFVLILISLYLRFTFYGKCGFEGFGALSDNYLGLSQCAVIVVTMRELTVYIFIYTILLALLWYTILAVIRTDLES